ncbi:unnamed protein product [Absidia cylindrospora]
MLYVPSPYSSGNNVSVCEQDKYSVSTPPSPPCGLATSDAYNSKETSDYNTLHESPPLTPKQLLDSQDQLDEQPTTTAKDGDEEDEFFFLSQLQNNTATTLTPPQPQEQHQLQDQQEQLENADYHLYDNEFEETDYQYQQQQYHHHPEQATYIFEPFDKSLYSTPSITDDDFETANRAFHATINKFSRQNYPEHRKRTPYNFLENWHLHSMYSKSQQILLGIPHVRPMVLLSGDDFMFTPPLLQQEEEEDFMDDHNDHQLGYLDQSMQMEWMDDGQMFEDDGEILDDGIVIMSAPDPPLIMNPSTATATMTTTTTPSSTVLNENAWMKNHVDFPSPHYHHHLDQHHNRIDDGEDNQQQDGSCPSTSSMISTSEKEPFYFSGGLTSELLHWYRTSDRGRPPSTIMENRESDDDIDEQVIVNMNGNNGNICNEDNNNNNNNDMDTHQPPLPSPTTTTTTSASTNDLLCPEANQSTIVNNHGSPTSYLSLADIVPSSTPVSPVSAQSCSSATSSSTQEPTQQYGATHDQQQQQHCTVVSNSYESRWINHRNMGLTDQLISTSDLVLTMASDYRLEGKKTTISFISCMIQIWQILFLTAEMMLAGLWGQQQQQKSTVASAKYLTGPRRSSTVPILPF